MALFTGLLGWVCCAVCVGGAALLRCVFGVFMGLEAGSLGSAMSAWAGGDAKATFVVAESPKMM